MRMSTKEKKNAGLEKRGRFHRKNCTASYQRGFKMMSRRFVSTSRSEPRFSRHWVCRKLLVELSRYVYVYTYVYVHVLYNIPTYFRTKVFYTFEGNVYVWAKRTCTCTVHVYRLRMKINAVLSQRCTCTCTRTVHVQ